ncbi:hypothetical protein F8568_032220 [Actinomadura sp. LD22]|uniref:Uncharacterized protein n=1 Tax=Actinomadura physcomitrii TaxID=2650748 RepID=A0A6I4MNC5_9ACTN|nr:hypothetical protein [Actinomadura physcomitrii]MWA04951.1 hypothetical protein [Actinomadura physcomitrii]
MEARMTSVERTGHSTNCEQAEKPPCACACGGAEHGWQGALSIAAASSPTGLDRFRRAADKAWEQATRARPGQRKPGGETAEGQHAAIKSFIADVIKWLRCDQSLRDDTKRLGEPFRISRDRDPDKPRRKPTPEEEREFIEKHVIPRLRDEYDEAKINAFQKQAAKVHFWCELLAQTAHALSESKRICDEAKSAVVAALTRDDDQHLDGWAKLLKERVVIERAVSLVFEQLPRLVTGGVAVGDVFRLIWPVRVLAVLMCREPRRHWAVRRYCIEPIVEHGSAEIRQKVKDRLREAFPADWPAADGGVSSDLGERRAG